MIYCLFVISIVVGILLALHLLWKGPKNDAVGFRKVPKLVTVQIAARDEATNIEECLIAILNQAHPETIIQVLLGDDASTDDTLTICRRIEAQFPDQLQVVEVSGEVPAGVNPKARVLSILGEMASGEMYFYTDADIQVPPTWIKTTLERWPVSSDLAIGPVKIIGEKWFSRFQNYDMAFAQAMLWVLGRIKSPLAVMGNNMAITKKSYEAVGGFAGIPFSVTEDYEIFKQLRNAGFSGHLNYSKETIVASQPVEGFVNLLRQRKRWMQGAIDMPLWIIVIFFFNALFYPAIVLLCFLNPLIGFLCWGLKSTLQAALIGRFYRLTGQDGFSFDVLSFDLYAGLLSSCLAVFFFLPFGHNWKGRSLLI